MTLRPATPEDLPALARLWQEGWHEAHAAHVPPEVLTFRAAPYFAERLRLMQAEGLLRMAGTAEAPLGFCAIEGEEIDQLYVSPAARGTGLASELLHDGEARLAATGVQEARLLCMAENTRAARFYGREGWRDAGTAPHELKKLGGTFTLPVTTFRKSL
ncbi:GNAT family N-acetyltransferase [Pseudoroseicyclus tamaricis]|uniref:GNAT family N-acetyltransferase n=1 Tax=Pseudoroseicyclus tamaricis TaxID=2705421 RepID=A0A6B2JV60_9RHOB|nr:GNAT family N-acetyltransferase [Pseudoroseicyclus tamaricis]NDV01775.1 GNAT family N-acetyltransferase [Pseudoroseicyclus tamaricis]